MGVGRTVNADNIEGSLAQALPSALEARAAKGGRAFEAWEFRCTYALTFPVFLATAAIARLLGWHWRPWPPGPKGYASIVEEARAAAGSFIPFAFL